MIADVQFEPGKLYNQRIPDSRSMLRVILSLQSGYINLI